MLNIVNYFDLNQRVLKNNDFEDSEEKISQEEGEFMGIRESPLSKLPQKRKRKPKPKPRKMSIWEQLMMYFGTSIGVFFSSLVNQPNPIASQISYFTLSSILTSLVIALSIIPITFEKLNVKPNTPFIVRFGLFVQNGVFWQVLIDFGNIALTKGG